MRMRAERGIYRMKPQGYLARKRPSGRRLPPGCKSSAEAALAEPAQRRPQQLLAPAIGCGSSAPSREGGGQAAAQLEAQHAVHLQK